MLTEIIRAKGYDLCFTLMEIGARIVDSKKEPFWGLIEQFPSSSLLGFEVDPDLCSNLNKQSPKGVVYYPVALGRTEESRAFHETQDPMCSSLYVPDERYPELFQNLEVMKLKAVRQIDTVSLNQFAKEYNIGAVDFIKIDIQGAELEVFQGGTEVLKDVLCIISEVEFLPLYKDQPLFGEVEAFLGRQGLRFHKFLGVGGRAMKPVIINGNPNFPVQHMWADAVFFRDLLGSRFLNDAQLLKLAILLDLYQSPDVAFFLLNQFDTRYSTELANEYMTRLTARVDDRNG
jgi:FkbM family methyltransferase